MMLTEPSPRVRRRCEGGVVWEKFTWFVWRGWGWGVPAEGVGSVVMGTRVSSCF